MQIPRIVRDIPYWLYRARRRFATAAVAGVACLLLAHVVFGANGIAIYLKKREENKKLQTEIQVLQQESQRLQQSNQALSTDPKAIEREAREQLKYARPGEVVYTLPEAKTKPAEKQTAQANPVKK